MYKIKSIYGFDLSLPPASAAADCRVFVASGPWRRGGSRLSLVGGLHFLFGGLRSSFLGLRFVGANGVQVVVAAPCAIRSHRLQPHLDINIERLFGVVWSSRISSGCGDLRIVKELHRQFFLLLCLWDECGLLDLFGDFPSATNKVRSTQEGVAAAARHRYGLEIEDEGLLKDLVVIFIFLRVFCTVCCFF
jgi:hypothetical protein